MIKKLETDNPIIISLFAEVQDALLKGCKKARMLDLCERISAVTGIKSHSKSEPKYIHEFFLKEYLAYYLISDIWIDKNDFLSHYMQFFNSPELDENEVEVRIWESAFDNAFPNLPAMSKPKYKALDWVYCQEIEINCVVAAIKPTFRGYFYIICPHGLQGKERIIVPEVELEPGQMPTAVSITGVVWEYRDNGNLVTSMRRIPVETDSRVLEKFGIGKTVIVYGRLTTVEDAVLWNGEWVYSVPQICGISYNQLTFIPDLDTLPILLKETKEHDVTIWQLDKDKLIIQYCQPIGIRDLVQQTIEVINPKQLAQRFPEYMHIFS